MCWVYSGHVENGREFEGLPANALDDTEEADLSHVDHAAADQEPST